MGGSCSRPRGGRMSDIDITGGEADERFSLMPETPELRGCWRRFFVVAVAVGVVLAGLVGYRIVFVVQPWKSETERRREAEAARLADLPPVPDVIGLVAAQGVPLITEAGYLDVLLFSADVHGVRLGETQNYDPNLPITDIHPGPGEIATGSVNVFLGEKPERPEGVGEDSFYFPHKATIDEHGTFQCVSQCHSAASGFCERCHENRLRSGESAFVGSVMSAPELADAVASAAGLAPGDVVATAQEGGWYRADIHVEDPQDVASVAEEARAAALAVFPKAFSAQPDAEVILVRWLDAGSQEPIIEIGLERKTYERMEWMSVSPERLPWLVDRYVVASGSE